MMRARSEAITRLCFDAAPSEDDLALLGSRERWLLYRTMVRSRFTKVARTAFPRTHAAMGDGAFEAIVDAWLAEGGPRTRYFWQVPLAIADFAAPRLPAAPAHLADLFRYEVLCWRVRQMPAEDPEAAPFAFERPPVVTPTLELAAFGHPVHLLEPGAAEREEPVQLCVYRTPKHGAEALRLTPIAFALLEDWRAGERTVADSVRRVTAARGTAIDQGFVEKLGTLVADLIERGVLLGAKP